MVWGGEKIAPYKGVSTDAEKIGESWELSGHFDHQTPVAGGPYDGTPIDTLLETRGDEIMGARLHAQYGNKFPLLIKFIDACSDLSIQVHPDDKLAAERHNDKGKTEMWYVIGADEGASLYAGMKESINPEIYEKLVSEDRITDALAKHEVHPGDVFFLPAGRVHAICAGCFLAEIQQTSDLTYRIYDYGRLGLDGKPRQLHTALAKDAIDYRVYPSYRTEYESVKGAETALVSCKYFTTMLFDLDGKPASKDISALDSFVIVICTEGSGRVVTDEGSVTMRQGETALVSCSSKSLEFVPDGAMKVLLSYID